VLLTGPFPRLEPIQHSARELAILVVDVLWVQQCSLGQEVRAAILIGLQVLGGHQLHIKPSRQGVLASALDADGVDRELLGAVERGRYVLRLIRPDLLGQLRQRLGGGEPQLLLGQAGQLATDRLHVRPDRDFNRARHSIRSSSWPGSRHRPTRR